MNNKAIAILGAIFLLIVGTLGYLLYAKYHTQPAVTTSKAVADQTASSTTPTSKPTTTTPSPTPPLTSTTPATPFVKLSTSTVVSPALFFSGTGVTFFDNTGQLFQSNLVDSNGQTQLDRTRNLGIKTRSNISRILWPAKGENFIAEFVDAASGKKTWAFFDSKVGDYIDLPPQIISLDWMPTGDKIAYVWLENGKATLNISDPDTKNWKKISDMWETDNTIVVSPDGLNIAYFENANSAQTNFINITSPDGKVWKGLIKEGFNFGVLWSPDSKKILFEKRDPNTQGYQIWYNDLTTGESKNLGLSTVVEKVAWGVDSQTIYASVPISGSADGKILTTDQFVVMDTASYQKKIFKSDSVAIDGRDISVSKQNDKLYFKNAQDGLLYYLSLH